MYKNDLQIDIVESGTDLAMTSASTMTSIYLGPDNRALSSFALASGILGSKLIFNQAFTGYNRYSRQVI
jgi:hypothetical protein